MTGGSGREAAAAAARVVELARQIGRDEVAQEVADALARPADTDRVAVVVAGETKRGKSSLVNALVGRPGLLPVDTEIATCVPLALRYGASEGVRVVHAGALEGEEVPIGALADWATVAGNPGNARAVDGIEVTLDHPLLARGLVLVDTPGVGGLEAAPAEATLASLTHADALLLVTDAAAPLSDPELRFLERAIDRIATVIIVVAKIDIYRGWREVLDADRRLLERRVPVLRGVATLPVSSRLKARADEVEGRDASRAAALSHESGVDALEAAIEAQVIARRDVLQLLNLMQLTRHGLVRLAEPEQAAAAEPAESEALFEDLRRQQTRWRELGASEARVEGDLGEYLDELRGRLIEESSRRIEALARAYEPVLTRWRGTRDQLAERLADDLRALSAELQASLEEGLAAALERLVRSLPLEGPVTSLPAPPKLDEVSRGVLEVGAGPARASPTARVLATVGLVDQFDRGRNVVELVGAGVGLVINPMAAVAGGLLVGASALTRHRDQQRDNNRATVDAVLAAAARQLESTIAQRLTDFRWRARDALREVLALRLTELDEDVARHQRLLAADRDARQRSRELARERLAEIRNVTSAVDAATAGLEQGLPTSIGSP